MDNNILDYETAKTWISEGHVPSGNGIYAIFLVSADNLPLEWQSLIRRHDHLLYIGRAAGKDDYRLRLRLKGHFTAKTSSADTLRRSVGSVLREYLELRPVRAGGKWKFDPESERCLSNWIQENCRFNYTVFDNYQDIITDETHLITKHMPPLNKQNNPRWLSSLEAAHKDCADHAFGSG